MIVSISKEWTLRQALLVFALAVAAGVAGCGGGGGGGTGGVFQVVAFTPDGTNDVVFRNQPLVFEFSSAVSKTGVSPIGLQVLLRNEVIQGRVEVDGRFVTWSPVVVPGDPNDYVPENNPPINGIGFDGDTQYTVRMSANQTSSVKSRTGRPLGIAFQASFTTNNEFMPEAPSIPPTLLSSGSEIFDPPPVVDGDPFSSDPNLWPVLDPRDVSITLQFSEKLAPASVSFLDTAVLRNVTDIPGDAPAGVGEIALMDTRLSPTADALLIRNLVSLGDWPDSDQDYVFQLDLTQSLTDLAGNGLDRRYVLHFKTLDVPGEPNHTVFTETFETQDLMSIDGTTGLWGDGVLEGADVNRRVDDFVPLPQNNFNLPHPLVEVGNPLTPAGCRFQMKYDTDHLPALPGESVIGLAWSPLSNFAFSSVYREVVFKVGSFAATDGGNLDPVYDRNFSTPPPIVVFRGDYHVPFDVDAEWVDWPEFDTEFDLEQGRPMVIEWDMPAGGDTFQLFRNRSANSIINQRVLSNGGEAAGTIGRENTQYNARFYLVSKRSFGESVAIRNGLQPVDYGAAVVLVDPDRGGTRVIGTFGGSSGGLPATFSEDINVADGFTHLTFRVELIANPITSLVPSVRSVSYAYIPN